VRLEWTLDALEDLDVAGEFIRKDNPRAAKRMASRVEEAVRLLETSPALGRPGSLRGTRQLVVSGTPFIVVYRVRLDAIQVIRVIHHAQKWP
jgi:toxin ParE1/3/4